MNQPVEQGIFKSHLEELRRTGLLDTPPEEVFDRFTALAGTILGIPIVLMTLIDEDRQFFKSQVGLPEPVASTRETPLSDSICQYVVLNQAPLIVADVKQDAVLGTHPAVEHLGVRAYAGMPLTTTQGKTIGSFCAIDTQPHRWTDHEIEVLKGLAQAVTSEILLRMKAGELRRTAARVEGILESITDAFFQLDREWCFSYVNEQAVNLLGRSREELLGCNIWQEFPTVVDSTFERHYRHAVESGKTISFEEFFSTRGIWVEVHVYPSEEGLSVYFQDITLRRNDQERLQLLESVAVHANDTIIVTEADPMEEPGPRILYVNDAFTQMTGYSSEEALGRSPRFLQGAGTESEALDELRTAVNKWEPSTVEVLNYRKDGSTFWSEMSLVPIQDAHGHYTHWISIQRDVSERRRVQEVLEKAKNEAEGAREEAELARGEAERANLAKSEFLSRMSHELRTPLNAILGFGQLLKMADLAPDDRESADHIVVAGRHLLSLINEVLDISQIESGRLSLTLEPVETREICAEILGLVRSSILQNGLELHDRSGLNPVNVLADTQRLKQILLNLLSNAIKYNRQGGVISVYCESTSMGQVRFCVRDEGKGFTGEQLTKLFTPFERLGAQNSGIEGMGIGLALSRRLAESMGGALGVESVEGQGSTFWIELPSAPAKSGRAESDFEMQVEPSSSQPTWVGKHKVLYIEDNLSNLRLVESVLERRSDMELFCATSGRAGLEIVRRELPHLILLDLQMPEMNGEEVLHHLQQNQATSKIPVIIVSADATPSQVERLLQSGATAYVTKPFSLRELVNLVTQTLNKAPLS